LQRSGGRNCGRRSGKRHCSHEQWRTPLGQAATGKTSSAIVRLLWWLVAVWLLSYCAAASSGVAAATGYA
jgi:hypothetical protein